MLAAERTNPPSPCAEALGKRGIAVERAKDGDYKYRIAEGGKRSRRNFKGSTLGAQYERSQLAASIKAGRELALGGRTPEIDVGR